VGRSAREAASRHRIRLPLSEADRATDEFRPDASAGYVGLGKVHRHVTPLLSTKDSHPAPERHHPKEATRAVSIRAPVGVENSIASVAARQRHLVASTGFEPGSVMVSAIRAHSWVRATSRSASTFGQGPGRRRTNGERPRLHDHPPDATHQRAGRRIRIGHRLSEEAPAGRSRFAHHRLVTRTRLRQQGCSKPSTGTTRRGGAPRSVPPTARSQAIRFRALVATRCCAAIRGR
jgi:hypothetical protein